MNTPANAVWSLMAQVEVRAYFFAARLPVAMITKIAKATNAHQATLSVLCCHFRTSHMF
jgi:hypothetical protein